MKNFFEDSLVRFGVLLSLALVIGAFSLSSGISNRGAQEYITVTGSASKMISADHAEWTIAINRQSNNLKDGYTGVQKDINLVKQFLLEHKVPEENITLGSLNNNTLYKKSAQGYDTNTIEGYSVNQNVQVELDDPKLLQSISQDINQLVLQGVGLNSNSPAYYYTKLDDLKVEMLGEATKNAVERGRAIAKSTGRDVGVIRSANVGVFQITAKNSTDVSDYGIYDTTTIEKKVTAVVNANFTIR